MATIRVLQSREFNNKYLEVEVAQGLDFTEIEWLLRATYTQIQDRLFYLLREHYTDLKFLENTVIMFSPPHYRVTSVFAKSFHGWTDTAHKSVNLEDLRRALPVCSGAKAGQRIQQVPVHYLGWNYPLFDRMHRGVSCEDPRYCPQCREIYQSLQQCKGWSWNVPDVLLEGLDEYNMLIGLSPLDESYLNYGGLFPSFTWYSHGYFTSKQEWLRTAEVPSGRKVKDLLNPQRCHTRGEQVKDALVLGCGHRIGTDFLNLYWDVARKESPPCPLCFNKDFDSALYCKGTASASAWTPHTRRSIEWIVNLEGKASDKYEASVMNSVYKALPPSQLSLRRRFVSVSSLEEKSFECTRVPRSSVAQPAFEEKKGEEEDTRVKKEEKKGEEEDTRVTQQEKKGEEEDTRVTQKQPACLRSPPQPSPEGKTASQGKTDFLGNCLLS